MPFTFRPNDHVWVAIDSDGVLMRVEIDDHFRIREIRKHEFPVRTERPCAKMRPEVQQAVLAMAIDAAKALLSREFDPGPHDVKRDARFAVFGADR